MGGRPWRNAASLLLFVRASASTSCDYTLLMLRRSARSKFMPNAYIFPGGVESKEDFRIEWLDALRRFGGGRDPEELVTPEPVTSRRPLLLRPQAGDEGQLHRELAFRICALRETFEESGVFLQSKATIPDADLSSYRSSVHEDPSQLLRMCHKFETVPDVWALRKYSAWLTPLGRRDAGGRRFDTIFYAAFVEDKPVTSLDDKEIVDAIWTTPAEILGRRDMVYLAPPQVYELTRLSAVRSFDNLRCICDQKDQEGVDTWLPVLRPCSDSTISILPGDELYPKEPDFDGKGPMLAPLEGTHVELCRKYPIMNRMAIFSESEATPFISDKMQLDISQCK